MRIGEIGKDDGNRETCEQSVQGSQAHDIRLCLYSRVSVTFRDRDCSELANFEIDTHCIVVNQVPIDAGLKFSARHVCNGKPIHICMKSSKLLRCPYGGGTRSCCDQAICVLSSGTLRAIREMHRSRCCSEAPGFGSLFDGEQGRSQAFGCVSKE